MPLKRIGLAGLLVPDWVQACGEFLSKSPKLVHHDLLRWLLLAERYSLAPLRTLCLEQLLLALVCEPERGLTRLLQASAEVFVFVFCVLLAASSKSSCRWGG